MIYSYSRLGTFEQCPLRYKFKYIDKITPTIPGTIEGHLGSSVHKVLEWIYKKKQPPSIDEVVNYYTLTWSENFKTDFMIKEFSDILIRRFWRYNFYFPIF